MKNKITIITILLALMILFVGCKQPTENEKYDKETEPLIESDYVVESEDIILSEKPIEIELIAESDEQIESEELEGNGKKYPFTLRYSELNVTREDIDLMACIVHLEAGNQCFAGQRMVAEVILNRVVQGDMGGTTIHDVVFAKNQFTTAKNVQYVTPNFENYEAVFVALTETPITDEDVVYFAQRPYNNHVFCKIEDHYFCRKY